MERIWYQDPADLFATPERAVSFVPDPNTSLDAQLNAVMRFAIYASAIVALMRRSVMPLLVIVLATAAGTYVVHGLSARENIEMQQRMDALDVERDPLSRKLCSRPTLENPYMNVLMSDYSRFPERPGACDATLPDVAQRADDLYARNMYVDSDDVYGRRTGWPHQFYTTAATTIPNDQTGFAQWLYRPSPPGRGTCKDGDQDACGALMFHPFPGR
jgi:hypothetical protein